MEERSEYQILKDQKEAGDKLDALSVEMAAREGIKYSEAFRRIAILNPELVKQYRA